MSDQAAAYQMHAYSAAFYRSIPNGPCLTWYYNKNTCYHTNISVGNIQTNSALVIEGDVIVAVGGRAGAAAVAMPRILQPIAAPKRKASHSCRASAREKINDAGQKKGSLPLQRANSRALVISQAREGVIDSGCQLKEVVGPS
mmetsp:Transcript_41281/g.67399  ORF Transcript_41281/g.67399 Transcript_41281/m.67399 type:complete len:143 (+) Transcript_41281:110-538(+)